MLHSASLPIQLSAWQADIRRVTNDVDRARRALEERKTDEALILLWNAIEPARLAGDETALREIATLAQSFPNKEAADLVAATGVDPAAAPPEKTEQPATPTTTRRRLRPSLIWVAAVLLVAIVNLAQNFVPEGARTTKHTEPPAGAEPVTPGLHLVPMGAYPSEALGAVAETIGPSAGILFVRRAVSLDASTYDPMRKQYVAERLLAELRQNFLLTGPQTLIIGVTSRDMYAGRRMLEPRVSVARSDDGIFVVISTYGFGVRAQDLRAALERAILKELHRAPTEPQV